MNEIDLGFDIGMLLVRVYLGVNFIAYGGQKLFGLFGGPGLKGWSSYLRSLRMRSAGIIGPISAACEAGAAILMLLGLLIPLAAAGLIASMLVATFAVHWKNGYFNAKGGFTYPLAIIVLASAVAFAGPGSFAVGATWWQTLDLGAVGGLVALGLGVIGAGGALLTRVPEASAS
ncbi:DoxX family protein [Microbacterium soli]|uniref:DoxX family protein n=1 Tax=Microbacterium soli TaxID=446075 RepID=A0ABP7MXP8_9MICO